MNGTVLNVRHERCFSISGLLLIWAICLVGIGSVPALGASAGADVSAPSSAVSQDEKRSFISEKLVDLGAAEQQANLSVSQLSDADVNVLYDNPDMIQAAGDLSDEEVIILVFGVVVVLLLVIIIL